MAGRKVGAEAGGFHGWRGDFQGYFLGLRANNSKAYFESHRRLYDEEVRAPMVALLAALEVEFGPGRISRPNRDLRFSADKSPYKSNLYARTPAGCYVALDAAGLVAAGGRYMMEATAVARFREAVASDRPGRELVGVVGELRERGYEIGGQDLKRVPPPHPQDHPRAELLRHKRLFYWRRWEVGPWIATAEVLDRVALAWRDGAGLRSWLARHIDRITA
jgi:uncharacterized protein (TIGR02453 family)